MVMVTAFGPLEPIGSGADSNLHAAFSDMDLQYRNARPFLQYTDTYSHEAIDGANVARHYRRLREQSDAKRKECLELESSVTKAGHTAKETTQNHVAFLSTIAPFDDADGSFAKLVSHMQDYETLQQTLLTAWLRGIHDKLAVIRLDCDRIDDECAMVREMLVAGAREMMAASVTTPQPTGANDGANDGANGGANDGANGRANAAAIAAVTSSKLCPVCFERDVGVACVPCGHTLCGTCSSSTNSQAYVRRCPTCRSEVRESVKIFFSV